MSITITAKCVVILSVSLHIRTKKFKAFILQWEEAAELRRKPTQTRREHAKHHREGNLSSGLDQRPWNCEESTPVHLWVKNKLKTKLKTFSAYWHFTEIRQGPNRASFYVLYISVWHNLSVSVSVLCSKYLCLCVQVDVAYSFFIF